MGHGFHPDKAQVGRVSVLTKRQVSFTAIILSLTSKRCLTAPLLLLFLLLLWRVAAGHGGELLKEHTYMHLLWGTTNKMNTDIFSNP